MSKELIQSQFSDSAELYATSRVHATGASLAWLIANLDLQSDWRVLDIATGPGHTAFALAPHVFDIVATDLTPKMLEVARGLARDRNIDNVSFEVADAECLHFESASFDVVTCRIAPHHFARIDLFLSEVARVLKPGGRFGLVDNVAPDTRSTPGFSVEDLTHASTEYNLFEKIRDPGHHKALQFTEWLSALDSAGLEVLHHDLIEKPMAFQPWAERLGASAQDIAQLLRMVDEGSSVLRAFLKPEVRNGERWMTWTEAMFAVVKRGV